MYTCLHCSLLLVQSSSLRVSSSSSSLLILSVGCRGLASVGDVDVVLLASFVSVAGPWRCSAAARRQPVCGACVLALTASRCLSYADPFFCRNACPVGLLSCPDCRRHSVAAAFMSPRPLVPMGKPHSRSAPFFRMYPNAFLQVSQ